MIKAILSLFAASAPSPQALPAPIVRAAVVAPTPALEDHSPLTAGLVEMAALKRAGHSDQYAFACAMKRAFAEHYHAAPSNSGRKVFAALNELLARAIDNERGVV